MRRWDGAFLMPCSDSTLGTLYSDHHGWLNGWLRSTLGNPRRPCLAPDIFVRLPDRSQWSESPAPWYDLEHHF